MDEDLSTFNSLDNPLQNEIIGYANPVEYIQIIGDTKHVVLRDIIKENIDTDDIDQMLRNIIGKFFRHAYYKTFNDFKNQNFDDESVEYSKWRDENREHRRFKFLPRSKNYELCYIEMYAGFLPDNRDGDEDISEEIVEFEYPEGHSFNPTDDSFVKLDKKNPLEDIRNVMFKKIRDEFRQDLESFIGDTSVMGGPGDFEFIIVVRMKVINKAPLTNELFKQKRKSKKKNSKKNRSQKKNKKMYSRQTS